MERLHPPPSRSRRSGARAVGLGLVVAAAVAVGACAKTIDGARLEARIREDASGAGLAVAAVACPVERPARQGDAFTCTLTLDGGVSLTYDVEQTSDAGDYRYALAPNQVVRGEEVAVLVEREVAEGAATTVDVTCPKTVLAPGGRAQFDCRASLGEEVVTLAVSVEPDRAPRWEIKKVP